MNALICMVLGMIGYAIYAVIWSPEARARYWRRVAKDIDIPIDASSVPQWSHEQVFVSFPEGKTVSAIPVEKYDPLAGGSQEK